MSYPECACLRPTAVPVARDLQLVDSCLLTDEVCGELSHRAREIFADRTAGSAAPNEFGGVGTAEGQPVCTTQFGARARTPMWQSVSLSQLSPPRGSFVSLSSCKLRSNTAKEIGSPSAVVPVPSLLPVSHPCRRASRAQPAHPACAHMRTRARARTHARTTHRACGLAVSARLQWRRFPIGIGVGPN